MGTARARYNEDAKDGVAANVVDGVLKNRSSESVKRSSIFFII